MNSSSSSYSSSSLIPLFFLIFLSLTSLSSSISSPDLLPLQAFKSSSSSTNSALSSWSPATDPCSGTWLGVTCRDGRVTGLVLEGLHLHGSIQSLTFLPRLTLLSLKNNSLSSPPLHLLDLSPLRPHLKLLYLSHNRFSGPFPPGILTLRRLRRLDLAGNLLSGNIPADIFLLLPRLLTLRLERNLFTGEIPAAAALGLSDFNVSHNRLIGEIPRLLSSFPPSSFAGNWGLCGKPLLLRDCSNRTAARSIPPPITPRRKRFRRAIVIAGANLVAASITVGLVVFLFYCKKRGRERKGIVEERGGGDGKGEKKEEERERVVLFEGCKGFVVDDLMRGSAEMLGRGVVGTTYRVVMEEGGGGGGGVVVKRVRREKRRRRKEKQWEEGGGGGGGKEEEEEAEDGLLRELGALRHPNVVSLRAYHSSGEELLLVYDYLPNGSLQCLLHGNRGPGRTPVDWSTRLKLALGSAKGLTFLHGSSKSKLSHQHLASTNILIDQDGNACISDFSLNQLLSPSSPSSYNSQFTPPELLSNNIKARRITQKCDVYSFGVILLEILTGRTAGDHELDLTKWVQTVVREEWTSEVFDIELMRYKEMEDEMVALLQVALLCLAPEPRDRPRMSVVYKMIEDIRERGSKRGRGSHSPSLNGQSYESSSPSLSEDTPTSNSN